MGYKDYLGLFVDYTTWLLYVLVSFLCSLARTIKWWRSGVWQQVRDSRRPENYSRSAHKKTILWHHRLDIFIETRLLDYIVMHHSFLQPEYVLRDDVHLMQVTATEAVFVQLTKRARGPDSYPFSILGYNASAKHIITMPLESFNRLAESMPEDDAKVIFLQNQARCGGTLFTEVFKATGRCVTFNEPHPLNAACKFYYVKKRWDRPTMLKMLRNITRVQCKPKRCLKEKTLAYIIKPTTSSTVCLDLLQEAMPEAIQFFIYRDPIKVAISIRRMAEALPTLKLLFKLPNIPNMSAPLFSFIGYCDVDFRGWTPKTGHEIEWGYRVASAAMGHYLRKREQGVRIHGIRYAIFRDHPQVITDKIFAVCGLPADLVPRATEAFGRDSQEESPISMSKLKALNPVLPTVSPETMDAVREMAKALDVPGPDVWSDESFFIPGTLTPESSD